MDNRKRITHILIAGTLTTLLLSVFLVFRGSANTAAQEPTSADPVVEMVGDYETDTAALQAQIETLQAQNAAYAAQNDELRTAVTTLQARESEYQAQIEAANQTINQLSQSGTMAFGEQAMGEGIRPHHDH